MEDRIIGCKANEEDVDEISLRPRKLNEYIGQKKSRKILQFLLKLPKREMKHLTMFCCMDLLVLVRQPWPV